MNDESEKRNRGDESESGDATTAGGEGNGPHGDASGGHGDETPGDGEEGGAEAGHDHEHGARDHEDRDHGGHEPADHDGEHDHGDHDHEDHDHGDHDNGAHDHEGHEHGDHDHGSGHEGDGPRHHHKEIHPPEHRPAEDGSPAAQVDLVGVLPGEKTEAGRFEELRERLVATDGIGEVHLRDDQGRHQVCAHYDDAVLEFEDVVERIRTVGAEVAARYREKTWVIGGMDSPRCVRVIEYALERMEGALEVAASYGSERLTVEYDSQRIDPDDVVERVEALGYNLHEIARGRGHHHHHGGMFSRLQLPLVVVAGVLLATGFILSFVGSVQPLVSTGCYIAAVATGGFFAGRNAVTALREGRVGIESLMVLSAFGAGILGAWMEAAFLLFLFSLGHLLQHRAMRRARNALQALGEMRPETARVEREGEFTEVRVDEVDVGDVVLVRPGDRVPLDGVIVEGETSLEESAITGESMPVSKETGDDVYSGTTNHESAIEVEVKKLTGESVLDRVVDMVANAEARKSPTQRFTDEFEEKLVPVVLGAAVIVPAVLMVATSMGLQASALTGVKLLVAASPCALAISVPAAVLSSVSHAAQQGIMVKGGAYMEILHQAEVMAFDKTGTLTVGEPELVSVEPSDASSESELLRLTAAAEALSSHPLGKAVVRGAQERGMSIPDAKDLEAIHGKGIRARRNIDGQLIEVGNRALFGGEADIPDSLLERAEAMERDGETTMFVRYGGTFQGVIGVADPVREEAKRALNALESLGIEETLMLTGDTERVAEAIGGELGIDEVRGPLLPDEKVEMLQKLADDRVVNMTGDGVNDGPALAAASLGTAMGGAGTDVALDTADMVLMSDDLEKLPYALKLARRTSRVIKLNLAIALGVSALLVGVVIASAVVPAIPTGVAHVAPVVAVHEGSTLLVAANGLRLLG